MPTPSVLIPRLTPHLVVDEVAMEALRRHPLLENVSVVDVRQGVPQPPANTSIKAWLRRPLAFAFNPSILSDGKGSALVKVGTFSYCGLGSNGVSGAHVRMSALPTECSWRRTLWSKQVGSPWAKLPSPADPSPPVTRRRLALHPRLVVGRYTSLLACAAARESQPPTVSASRQCTRPTISTRPTRACTS